MSRPVVTTYERVAELPLTIDGLLARGPGAPDLARVRAPHHDVPPPRRRRGGPRRGRHLRPRRARRAAGARADAPARGRVDVRLASRATSASSTSSRPASPQQCRLPPLPPLGDRERGARPRAAPGRPLARRRARARAAPGRASSSRCGSATRRASSRWRDRLEVYPWLRFKLDGTPDWPGELIEQLVETGAIASIDFKGAYKGTPVDVDTDPALLPPHRRGAPGRLARGPRPHRPRGRRRARAAPRPHHLGRADPLRRRHRGARVPAARRSTSSRRASARSRRCSPATTTATRTGSRCTAAGRSELGVGRGQIQLLASLFHPDGVNDIAPVGLRLGRVPPRPRAEPAGSETRAHRHAPADVESRARCRPSSARSGWRASPRSPRCRSSRAAPTRSSRPRRASAPPRRRSSARAPPSGWTPSARASTSAPRSPPPARRSACSCGAWPRPRWRSPSAAPATSRSRPRSSARRRRPTASCWRCASWAWSRRRRARRCWLRVRGILLILFLVIALLALGWGDRPARVAAVRRHRRRRLDLLGLPARLRRARRAVLRRPAGARNGRASGRPSSARRPPQAAR